MGGADLATLAEFCSVATRSAGQSIVGTAAARTSAWLVIEYRPAWEAKGIERADFGEPLRGRLDGWLKTVEGMRAQLIRHPGACEGDLTVYFGVSDPGREQVRRLTVPDYDALAALDFPAVVAAMRRGEEPEVGVPVERPLVLVCTHGKRDRCCAKWGQPVYDALAGRDDIELWQTSHLGGHRYAATLLCLPQGLSYGWLEPGDAAPLVESILRGEIYRLDRLRGRTALSGPGQAAEHFVREHLNELAIDAVRVPSVDEVEGGWSARVEVDGAAYRVDFRLHVLEATAPPSCGKAPEPAQSYELTSIAAV